MSLIFFIAVACVETDPLPDVGACAVYPDGVYEYGQIGIGTCLAGPSALTFLDGGNVLAVTNTNPFLDFTGGSVVSVDLTQLDETAGRNLVTDLAPSAVGLPSFSGATAFAAPYSTLLVTNRYSGDERTREVDDDVWFVDVSNPRNPTLANDIGPDEGGAALAVGYDPNEIVYDEVTDQAWTINRTSHTVSTIDMGSRPARLVPPGGDGRLVADSYVDADASGSRAAFALLEPIDNSEITADHWDISWAAGTIRAWVADDAGLYRATGNGETTWVRSGIAHDVDLSEESDEVTTRDPAWMLTAGGEDVVSTGRLFFIDRGAIRAADDDGTGEFWPLEDDPVLEPTEDEGALADPFVVVSGGTWYLFYASGAATTTIDLATSVDGVNFSRQGTVFSDGGAALANPNVLWDNEVSRWRMWYSGVDTAGVSALRTAWSDDLAVWTEEVPVTTGILAPSVGYWSGRFHCLSLGDDGVSLRDFASPDGYTWSDLGVALTGESGTHLEDGVALQAANESAFRLENLDGIVFAAAVGAGELIGSGIQGWSLQIALGQVAGPEEVGELADDGLAVTTWVGDDVWLDLRGADGVARIGHGSFVAGSLSVDDEAVLEPGAEGAFDADGVHDAVVVDVDGSLIMFYAGDADGITTVGRATSADGVTWERQTKAVYSGSLDWESVSIVPGSVQLLDDGTLRLWTTASDGSGWRVSALDSADGGESFTIAPGETYPWQLDAGAPGSWNDSGIADPFVVRDGDVDRMWFSGFDGSTWQLGYAEREVDTTAWRESEDAEGETRAVLSVAGGALGVEGIVRPVARLAPEGWEFTYSGIDGGKSRVGVATALEPDRLHRVLSMPTIADTWGFTIVPPNDEPAISLDFAVGDASFVGWGCMSLALDDVAGLLYVGCKLVPVVYAIDVRDDSTSTWTDLNYLGVEAAMLVQTSTGSDSGVRDILVNHEDGTLYALMDEPEAVLILRADDIVDDATTDVLRDRLMGLLPLPRSFERDRGVETQSAVGPGQMILHPDGVHLFVTNFNNNSVSVYDLSLGPLGTLVGEVENIGENPYAIALSPDGTRAVVGNYSGEVGDFVSSTLVFLDADPSSATFLDPITWVVNR
ncbi:hypothetical protein LBMAG42_37180 [Deltaproteobacteria bacterium]|nr:hypothetical protein LBMAG42_37180 [Deltaproteobacteria bacterium]